MPTIYISDRGDDKNDGLSLQTAVYSLKRAHKLHGEGNDYSWHFGPRAWKRIKEELLPRFPNVDDVVALEHTYGCGVAIDAPDAVVPIRTLRNISLNPNFGGEVMVVSLGCEKLQPAWLLPPLSSSPPET